MNFQINQIITKEQPVYAEAADWCNSNNATIVALDDGTFQIQEVTQAPKPSPEVLLVEQEKVIRVERDKLLASSDYTQLADNQAIMTEEQKLAWSTYRQALRDLPSQDGFPWGGDLEQVPWPSVPTGE